jgi:hypothetical protein
MGNAMGFKEYEVDVQIVKTVKVVIRDDDKRALDFAVFQEKDSFPRAT